MADHFLTKTRISLDRCLEYGDGLALDAYPALNQTIASKVGPEAARLFAEPLVSRGNDSAAPTVSWYTAAEGNAQPYDRLDSAAQSPVAEALSRHLSAIAELIDDPDAGPLVAAALHVPDPEDIWVVGGRPVIVNWGMLAAGQGRDAASRKLQYDRGLGRFVPLGAAPPLTAAEREARLAVRAAEPDRAGAPPVAAGAAATGAAAGLAAQGASAAGGGAGGGAAGPDGPTAPDRPAREPRRVPAGAWVPLVALLLIAAGVLVWLLMPGSRIFPDRRADIVSAEEAAALAADVNRAMEARVAELRGALDGAVCAWDGTLVMPDGVTIEGLLPPDLLDPEDRAGAVREARRDPILPPDAARVQVPGQGGFDDAASLLAHIEARSAMVLVQGSRGLGTGTGFFVGPDLLVTNYHVVEGAAEDAIYVTNPALGSLKPAELVKALGPMSATGGDFALLRVPGAAQPVFQLLTTDETLRLQSVIAAGYPGDLLRTDHQFRSLREGNLDAVPELSVTDGTISAEQRFNAATRVIVHSAPISSGNSGGPLIDMCGRLIGVNTFVVQGPLRNLNFALSAADLQRFLEGTDALPTVVTSTCRPRVRRPAAPVRQAEARSGGTGDPLPPLSLPERDR